MRYISILFMFLFALSSGAQEESLVLEGYVEEGTVRAIVNRNARDQYLALSNVQVRVIQGDVLVKSMKTDSAGHYRIPLVPKGVYTVRFEKEGYLEKSFVLDASKFPEGQRGAAMMNADVALFCDLKDDELREYVQIPSAKCRYYKNRNEFRWDMIYSETQQKHFLNLLEKATIAALGEK